MVSRLIVLLLIVLVVIVPATAVEYIVFAQDAKPAPAGAGKPERVEIKSEASKYRLLAIQNKYAFRQQQLNNLILQFMNSNPDAKAIQADMNQLQAESADLQTKILTDEGLSPEEYRVEGEPPAAVLIKTGN